MSAAVGTRGAYQELDERFLPPKPLADAGELKIGSRLIKDIYQLNLLGEVTDPKKNKQR